MKRTIRGIADRRLSLQPIYRSDAKKLAAADGPDAERHRAHQLLRDRATEYSKASTRGTWEEAFS